MTVLLVLFTLLLFLAVDYFVHKSRLAPKYVGARAAQSCLRLPHGIRLASNHIWLRDEADGLTTVGVDEFIGRLIGRIDALVLPEPDTVVTPAMSEITLRQGGKSLELASPVLGHVVEVNQEVLRDPSLARTDPYGAGWLVRVKQRKEDHASVPFFVVRPAEWLNEQYSQVKEFLLACTAPAQLATMQDGGIPEDGQLENLDAQAWREFKRNFATLHDRHQIHTDQAEKSHA
jgi:glycine cleavage system H protein